MLGLAFARAEIFPFRLTRSAPSPFSLPVREHALLRFSPCPLPPTTFLPRGTSPFPPPPLSQPTCGCGPAAAPFLHLGFFNSRQGWGLEDLCLAHPHARFFLGIFFSGGPPEAFFGDQNRESRPPFPKSPLAATPRERILSPHVPLYETRGVVICRVAVLFLIGPTKRLFFFPPFPVRMLDEPATLSFFSVLSPRRSPNAFGSCEAIPLDPFLL